MKLLEGKTALITGAARGIGKAIALRYASEGANIAFTDLVIDENAKATENEIAAFGTKVKDTLRMRPILRRLIKWWMKLSKILVESIF